MNSIDFFPDKEIILGALNRIIIVGGAYVTNIDFALHLFLCGRDTVTYQDALALYGYVETDFLPETSNALIRCYNMGNIHIKRQLAAELLTTKDKEPIYKLLANVFKSHMSPDEGSMAPVVNINVAPSNGKPYEDEHVLPEQIVHNEVPDAPDL